MADERIIEKDKIREVLRSLRLDKIPMEVSKLQLTISGTIARTAENSFTLLYYGYIDILKQSEYQLSAQKGENLYKMNCKLLSHGEKELTFENPEVIQVFTQRKAQRVKTERILFSKFKILHDWDKNIDEAMHQDVTKPQQLQEIYQELYTTVPNIKKILLLCRREIDKISDQMDIQIYKEEPPSSFQVRLLREFREALFVADTNNPRSYVEPYENFGFMSYNRALMQKSKDQAAEAKEIIKKMVIADREKNLKSYIYVPVVLSREVVGHVYTARTLSSEYPVFSTNDVYYVKSVADIVSEALIKARLFRLESGSELNVKVEDISLTGCLLVIDDPYIMKFMHQGVMVQVSFGFPDRIVEIRGEIRRVFSEDNKMKVGIHFAPLRRGTEEFLQKYIKMLQA